MDRLTSNKPVEEMGMYELAHNCCYYENGNAVYRDFEIEMDAREFARNLMVTLTDDELSLDDDVFDEEVLENLQYDQFSDVRGLIALFYRNLWAMADLRERLKEYEDAEEHMGGWIPCISDQKPKEGMFYNVTIFDGEDYRTEPAYYARIGYFGQKAIKAQWWTDCTSNAELIEDGYDKVIAWQPLPESYRPPAAGEKTHKK